MIFFAHKESITMAISFVFLLVLTSCSTTKTNENTREVANQQQVSAKSNFVKFVRNDRF